jgi:hypothetical protein
MSFNEKNSKYSSSNNYFKRKGVAPIFKTLVSSDGTLFPDKMKKMEEILRKAKMFPK